LDRAISYTHAFNVREVKVGRVCFFRSRATGFSKEVWVPHTDRGGATRREEEGITGRERGAFFLGFFTFFVFFEFFEFFIFFVRGRAGGSTVGCGVKDDEGSREDVHTRSWRRLVVGVGVVDKRREAMIWDVFVFTDGSQGTSVIGVGSGRSVVTADREHDGKGASADFRWDRLACNMREVVIEAFFGAHCGELVEVLVEGGFTFFVGGDFLGVEDSDSEGTEGVEWGGVDAIFVCDAAAVHGVSEEA
jgi:hypothetical protein